MPANPAQYGCAKVACWNKCEVKFVTGVWVMFKYLPLHPQPCKRVSITGWMSVAHWNGNLFRIGETGDGVPDIDDDERELADIAHSLTLQELAEDYTSMIQLALQLCQPRMKEREDRIRSEKIEKLQKGYSLALSLGES